MAIEISNLPTIPPADIARGLTVPADATDANGQTYTGKVAFSDAVDGGGSTAQVFNFSKVITSAEILTMDATPVALGLNVPTGFFPNIVGDIWLYSDYAGVAYATNTSMRIRSVGGSQNYISAVNVLAFSADVLIPLTKNAVTSGKGFETGADLEAYVPSGAPTAGTSDITIYGQYTLIEL